MAAESASKGEPKSLQSDYRRPFVMERGLAHAARSELTKDKLTAAPIKTIREAEGCIADLSFGALGLAGDKR